MDFSVLLVPAGGSGVTESFERNKRRVTPTTGRPPALSALSGPDAPPGRCRWGVTLRQCAAAAAVDMTAGFSAHESVRRRRRRRTSRFL